MWQPHTQIPQIPNLGQTLQTWEGSSCQWLLGPRVRRDTGQNHWSPSWAHLVPRGPDTPPSWAHSVPGGPPPILGPLCLRRAPPSWTHYVPGASCLGPTLSPVPAVLGPLCPQSPCPGVIPCIWGCSQQRPLRLAFVLICDQIGSERGPDCQSQDSECSGHPPSCSCPLSARVWGPCLFLDGLRSTGSALLPMGLGFGWGKEMATESPESSRGNPWFSQLQPSVVRAGGQSWGPRVVWEGFPL